jgi:hypothetical protein
MESSCSEALNGPRDIRYRFAYLSHQLAANPLREFQEVGEYDLDNMAKTMLKREGKLKKS